MIASIRQPLRRVVPGWLLIAVLTMVIWSLLRVVLWLDVGPQHVGWGNALLVFPLGLGFDFATLALVIAPLLFIVALVPNRLRATRSYLIFRWAYVWLACAVVLLVAVAEFLFWQEFTTRFNFIAVDYLVYRREVLGNIWQSYPVVEVLLAIAALSLAVTVLLARRFSLAMEPRRARTRIAMVVAALLLPLASVSLVSIDEMSATGNAYADELIGNGTFTFVAAYRRNDLDYDKFYRVMPQPEANAVLRELGVLRQPLDEPAVASPPKPAASANPLLHRPRNVVLISIESMSAKFLGVYGSPKHLTPNLDRLSKESMTFDHFFATGTRTVRGLEALSVGIPPVPGQSVVRRPGNEHLATLGGLLAQHGYAVSFIYGGYGLFDNMNDYFRGNGYGIVDRTDFDEKTIAFANIWGVADESLFGNSIGVFDKAYAEGKPFFAHIMTTSNHRPFTYPDGRIDIPSPGERDGGVKYTDYAIGKFIEDARSKPWFDDTLFVITADHCAAVAGETRLPVPDFRIPLIIYGPKLVAPTVVSQIASQIDLPPTLLALLGFAGQDNFFGHDLFAATAQSPRAFISTYQELGYYKNDTLTVLSPRRKVEAFSVDPVTLASVPRAVDERLAREAIAYYQTAERAFKQGALTLPAASTADASSVALH